jgi:cytochrome c oxidase subunit III
MSSSNQMNDFPQEIKEKNAKLLLYIAIGSMVMLFAGITSGYIVSKSASTWLYFDLPAPFWFSTGIILLSSLTMKLAMSAVKSGNYSGTSNYILITLLLGLVFAVLQFWGWSDMISQKIFFAGKSSNSAGSYMYVITGLHLAHLLGGLIALLVSYNKSLSLKYTVEKHAGLTLTSTYWHFLDILWVYLFLFLFFAR